MAKRTWLSFLSFNKKPKARKYEGASKSKRLSRWKTESTSANAEIAGGLSNLRNRARDLRRNNPYAAKAIQVIASNTVGSGIQTQFRDGQASKLEAGWKEWAESTNIDFDGRHNLYGLQKLIMEAVAESGEVLIRKRFVSGLKYPLQYQILESDFIDTNRNEPKTANGNTIIQGIEFDPQGRRVAYYIFEAHPGGYDQQFFFSSLTSNRIPKEEIRHVYRMDRPGQARGVSWLAPVIVRLKDLDDYEDAQLMRQKIAACFTAFIRDINGDFTDQDEDCDTDLGDRLEPAIIEELPPGKTIEFANPPTVENYEEYMRVSLRGIAAGTGCTYEAMTGDLSSTNFSSGRMGWIEFNRNIKSWQEHIMYAHVLEPIVSDFKQMMEISGVKTDGIKHVHVPPKRELIDPSKEISASVTAIRAGLTTLTDEILAQGKDPVEHMAQLKKDKETLESLGLILDSDPSKVMKAGIVQTYVENSDGDDKPAEPAQKPGAKK